MTPSTRRQERLVVLVAVALFALLAGPRPVAANEEHESWMPFVDAGFGIHSQIVRSKVFRSTEIRDRGTRDLITSMFKTDLGLRSPSLTGEETGPRIYVRGGYRLSLSETVRAFEVLRTPSADEYAVNPALCGIFQDPRTESCDHSILIETEIEHMWAAGVGIEHNGNFLDQYYQVSLGLEYLGQEITYQGQSRTTDRGRDDAIGLPPDAELLFLTFPDAEKTEINHLIGPRFALSADVGRMGPVKLQFVADLAFLFYLDRQAIEMTSVLGPDSTSFRVEKELYITHVTAGLRFLLP